MHARTILQSLQQGILICNRNARIIYFNDAYGEFIGKRLEEVQGEEITKYRKHAMVPQVIQSQIPIEGIVRTEGNQEYFASVYPIMEGDIPNGTISIVTTLAQYQLKVKQKTEKLAERVRKFEREEILAEVAYCGGGVDGKKRAAAQLGISLATLYNKIKED